MAEPVTETTPATTTAPAATPPAAGSPPATPPSTSPPATTAAGDTELGEGGKTALEAERRARRDADTRATTAERQLEELRVKGLSDQEKAVEAAKTEGRTEALAEVTGRLVKAEARAAAAGKLANPQLAELLLADRLAGFVSSDGSIDAAAIAAAIERLVKDEPYLAATVATTPPAAGSTPPAPAGSVVGGAQGGASPTFKRSQLRDPAFFAANRDAVLKAATENRITDD